MCYRQMIIKTHSPAGQKLSFVPCGRCEECRDSNRLQWQFRLRCELDYCRKLGWHIGFFTLTYDDEHLPHIPESCFRVAAPEQCPPCFSRHDVRTFIDNIRKRIHERYKVKSLRYLVASEFGKSTQRPHYHGIICFPSEVPPDEMFDLIKSQWKCGFVFPKDYLGGVDSHGYHHKPFIIDGDVQGAAQYASKYVCKDLDFFRYVDSYEFVDKDDPCYRHLKDCFPFHLQSRGIGSSYLAMLDLTDMLRVLREGESFVGVNRRVTIPLYVRNKILYNNRYEFFEPSYDGPDVHKDWIWNPGKNRFTYCKGNGTHCRSVIREPSDVYCEHYRELYAQKLEYYTEFFTQLQREDYWIARKLDRSFALRLSSAMSSVNPERMARYYLCYRGVEQKYWNFDDDARQFFQRYDLEPVVSDKLEPWFVDRFNEFEFFDKVIDEVCNQLRFAVAYNLEKRNRSRALSDYYSHLT